jgi:hypothetical protein
MEKLPWEIYENVSGEGDLPNVKKGASQCKKVRASNGKEYFVHVKPPRLSDISQLDTIGNISERPQTDGIYNYIIYKTTDGSPTMLFAKYVFPNELASKHFYLLLYAMNKGLTTSMTPLLAGELKKDGETYEMNFQSGTYTKAYKEDFISEVPDMTEDTVEKKWFDTLKPMIVSIIGSDNLNYVSPSFFDTEVIAFDKNAFKNLESLGREILLFENIGLNENLCRSIDIFNMVSKGLTIPSMMYRSNSCVLNKDPVTKQVSLKPEYKDVDIKGHYLTLEQVISQTGGKRTRRRGRRRRRKKTARRK